MGQGESIGGAAAVWFACPHCGGPAVLCEEDVSGACPHCRSLLFLDRDGGAEIGAADCVVRGADDLREVVVERRLAEVRARIVQESGLRDPHGAPLEPPFLQQALKAEAGVLRERIAIGSHALLWAPYLHVDGIAWQACFGRRRGGAKRIELRSFLAEATERAYDATLVNLRDRGLRLSVTRRRLLGAADVEAGFTALCAAPDGQCASRALESLRSRAARPGLVEAVDEELVRFAGLAPRAPALLYKPYWVAQVTGGEPRLAHARGRAGGRRDDREDWLLVDGQTRLVAGELAGEAEARALLAAPRGSPLARRRQVVPRLLASRCVECGRDLPHEARAWVRPCPSCRVGLLVGPHGLERRSYRWVEPPPGLRRPTWLPFWRMAFRVRSSAGAVVARLDELGAALGALPGLCGDALWVPGLRLLGTLPGERCFDQVAEWLGRRELPSLPGPLPHSQPGALVAATLPGAEAAAMAPAFLAAAHDARSVARLNARAVREWIADATVECAAPELAYLPAAAGPQGYALLGDGPVVPPLLVTGGPALDQQRRPLP